LNNLQGLLEYSDYNPSLDFIIGETKSNTKTLIDIWLILFLPIVILCPYLISCFIVHMGNILKSKDKIKK
jgi:hypothetical protein